MTNEIKRYLNWPNLVLYTKEFKEWIWKLFRSLQARISHIEKDVNQVKKNSTVDYEIKKIVQEEAVIYSLIEMNSHTQHGSIYIDSSAGIMPVIWEDIYYDE